MVPPSLFLFLSLSIYMHIYMKLSIFVVILCLICAEGKPIPTQLRNGESAPRHEINLENTAGMGICVFFLLLSV